MNALVFVSSAFFTFFTHQIFDQNFANAAQSGLQGKPNENLTFSLFSDNLFHFLDVPKIAETFVQTTKQCLLQCIKNHLCLSTNVAAVPQPNGHVSCELLSIDKYNASENFVRSFTSHHYSIMVSLKGNNRFLAHGIGKRDREMKKWMSFSFFHWIQSGVWARFLDDESSICLKAFVMLGLDPIVKAILVEK